MAQQIIAIALGLYLLGESIAAAAAMQGGDRLCRVAKYMITGALGIWMVAEPAQVDGGHLATAFALSLFVWPKMLDRIKNIINRMENWHA